MTDQKQNSFKDNFTPVSDILAAAIGLTGAALFGLIWRYSQMKNRSCSLSQDSMAKLLGISRRTVNTYLGILVDQGLINDYSPERSGSTKVYKPAPEWDDRALIILAEKNQEHASFLFSKRIELPEFSGNEQDLPENSGNKEYSFLISGNVEEWQSKRPIYAEIEY